jgi:Mitochondrial ribosomal protein L27
MSTIICDEYASSLFSGQVVDLTFNGLDSSGDQIRLTMVRPSAAHSARLRLTTKQVNGGYYKGNRTGSMGAHTEWGGYVIDYRKVRNFNCPDLNDNRVCTGLAQALPQTNFLSGDSDRQADIGLELLR